MDYSNDDVYTIQIVQGDTIPLIFKLTNADSSIVTTTTVEHLYFSCKYLNYQAEVTYSSATERWHLTIPAATTATFKATAESGTNYDLTAQLNGGQILTTVYRGKLSVFTKNNAVVISDDE